MTRPTDWRHVDLDGALAILDGWVDHRVTVSVDLAAGAPGLAGMAGVLRPAGRDGSAITLELGGSDAWLRLPRPPGFRGASYDPEAQVLVLEYAGEDPAGASGVLLDIQRSAPPGR